MRLSSDTYRSDGPKDLTSKQPDTFNCWQTPNCFKSLLLHVGNHSGSAAQKKHGFVETWRTRHVAEEGLVVLIKAVTIVEYHATIVPSHNS